jgi:hypothetical protein
MNSGTRTTRIRRQSQGKEEFDNIYAIKIDKKGKFVCLTGNTKAGFHLFTGKLNPTKIQINSCRIPFQADKVHRREANRAG